MATRKTGAATAAPAATTRIRILPNRGVVIDGATRHAGWEGDVPTDDARTLIAEGYAEDASKAKPKAKAKAAPEPKTKRRPLTPRVIEDGEEERGG